MTLTSGRDLLPIVDFLSRVRGINETNGQTDIRKGAIRNAVLRERAISAKQPIRVEDDTLQDEDQTLRWYRCV